MGTRFDWQFSEEIEPERPPQPRPQRLLWFWITAVLLTAVLLGGWAYTRQRLAANERRLIAAAQAVLDVQREAFLAGDGELFFSAQADTPAWLAAQLRPENQALQRAGLRVTEAERHGDVIWALAEWPAAEGPLTRLLFFQEQDGRLLQIPSDDTFWGERIVSHHGWGTLQVHAADEAFAADIADAVSETVAELCAESCLRERLPLTLIVRGDFQETATPGRVYHPSPHFLGLNADGAPSERFWQALAQRVADYLTPATIRFGVPDLLEQRVNYSAAARAFMTLHPEITVELVPLDEPPGPEQAAELDGAAFTPTPELVAAGAVRDLTDLAAGDAAFNDADFYAQIWPGAQWQGRMWFVPQAAQMRLLFYDKPAYATADLSDPWLHWTWEEMEADARAAVAAQPDGAALVWGYVDTRLNTLFSYAYGQQVCREVPCTQPLGPREVVAALDWYREAAGRMMPDVARMTADERARLLTNWQAIDRRVAIWVDDPVYYEHRLLLAPVGVAPFPGSARFDGVTPLYVEGNFISAVSQRPYATWQWLKFLSYEPPSRQFRMVPARPSVAAASRYWQTLPRPLAEAMRTAFPFARAVSLADQQRLTWEQVSLVAGGDLSPEAAAQAVPRVRWFMP